MLFIFFQFPPDRAIPIALMAFTDDEWENTLNVGHKSSNVKFVTMTLYKPKLKAFEGCICTNPRWKNVIWRSSFWTMDLKQLRIAEHRKIPTCNILYELVVVTKGISQEKIVFWSFSKSRNVWFKNLKWVLRSTDALVADIEIRSIRCYHLEPCLNQIWLVTQVC